MKAEERGKTMKNKVFLIIFAAFYMNFCLNLNNIAFAIVDTKANSRYPDYAYEFTGRDKCEGFNRKLFIFNLKLNKYLIRPINIVWASVMPQYGMDRVKNAYNNANFPVRFISCTLQKDFKSSKQETLRFLTNTTLGLGGLFDPAKNKFKLDPRQEDIEQALAYYKVKQGPYLVLPVLHGNVRDIIGQVLDYPLNPCSYALGPFAAIATTVFFVNNTTYTQPLVKRVETTYADPYEVARQVDGIGMYIKNANLDRKKFLEEKIVEPQNVVEVRNTFNNLDLKPDIELTNYNPQSPLIDSMRTALFDGENFNNTIWSDMSIWNKSFDKRIKTTSVSIYNKRPKYKYRYILQKNKTSPVAILYPSIGEGITADKSTCLAKILYDEGYSVVMEGSSCQWEFIESMPVNYRPGLPSQDAYYLRVATAKILDDLQIKKGCKFDKKIIVGSSFGGLTALFVAAQEGKNNTLNISNYISINPPVETLFALKQVDKYSQDWKNNPSDLKKRLATTAEKVVQATQNICDKHAKSKCTQLPFNDDEAKLILGFVMRQKLSDVVFTIEHGSRSKKSNLYDVINNMSFSDYAQKYLLVNQNKPFDQINYESSLYSIANFLQENQNYKIYHSIDDYYTSPEQLTWLKQLSGNKSILFSNGSHLGCMYRKEFIDDFKKEIKLKKPNSHSIVDEPVEKELLLSEQN